MTRAQDGRKLDRLVAFAVPGALAATIALGAAGPSAQAHPGPVPRDEEPWRIEATDVRVIGGYGDNFAYDGENVRPLEGRARMTVHPDAGKAELEIRLRTTEASGPIRFSAERSWEGEIRIVQTLDTERMQRARIAERLYLHGDTGNEAPVMPKLYNYFATWGPATIWVDGEKVIPRIGSHTMFSTQARDPETGKIANDQGGIYSPRLEDKTGFTDPGETEFHFVAHTTEPDPNNFPPHTGWIHLHFAEVEVESVPEGVSLPLAPPSTDGGR